jgi:transcriptional regulator with XRE-family HTH domain
VPNVLAKAGIFCTHTRKEVAMDLINLAKEIKAKRKRIGMSVADVAKHTGLSRSYIYDIECGRTNPSLRVMTLLQETLGVEIFSISSVPLTNNEFVILQYWRDENYGGILRMIATALEVVTED